MAKPNNNRSGQDLQEQTLGLTSGRAVMAAPSPASLPGRRCTVTPARWLPLGIRGSWLYPGVGAPRGSDGGTLTPSHGCPAGRYRRHPREVITEGALHPSRNSEAVCFQVSEGASTGVGRDEEICLYERGCIRGGERELAGGVCCASANLQGGSSEPALPSASRGAGVSAVSPARVALSEGQGRRGPQVYSGAGVEPMAGERQRPRGGSDEGRAGALSLMPGTCGEADGAPRAVTDRTRPKWPSRAFHKFINMTV